MFQTAKTHLVPHISAKTIRPVIVCLLYFIPVYSTASCCYRDKVQVSKTESWSGHYQSFQFNIQVLPHPPPLQSPYDSEITSSTHFPSPSIRQVETPWRLLTSSLLGSPRGPAATLPFCFAVQSSPCFCWLKLLGVICNQKGFNKCADEPKGKASICINDLHEEKEVLLLWKRKTRLGRGPCLRICISVLWQEQLQAGYGHPLWHRRPLEDARPMGAQVTSAPQQNLLFLLWGM